MICILLPYSPTSTHAGGPIKSIVGTCDYLEGEFYCKILAKSSTFQDTLEENKALRKNLCVLPKFTLEKLFPLFKSSSIIWINSVYSISFSFIPLITLLFLKKKTVLISTRGQLLSGALNLKKKVYLQLYKYILKLTGHSIFIHYATSEEKEKSYPVFKNFPFVVFANPLVKKETNIPNAKNKSDVFVIGYFGRVAPIKNIEFVIKLLPQLPDFMEFHIYGVVTSTVYNVKLKKLIDNLQLHDRVKFKGVYSHCSFNKYAEQVDLIVLPSISESFCYVFFEAIENKKPILGSTGLPWKIANDYESKTILSLEPTSWVEQIINIAYSPQHVKDKKQENLDKFYKFVASSIKQDTIKSFKNISK